MGRDAAWIPVLLASKSSRHCSGDAHFAVCHVDGVGPGPDLLLQRRLFADLGRKRVLGPGNDGAQGLGGNLAGHWSEDRSCAGDWGSYLGPGLVTVFGTQRLPRGDLSYVLLQSLVGRRRPDFRNVVRRNGGDGARDRGTTFGDAP